MASIGPQLPAKRKRDEGKEEESAPLSPPTKQPRNQDEIDVDGDSDSDGDDGYGPKMPTSAVTTSSPKSRSFGPAMPDATPSTKPNDEEIDLQDSDSDDYGPLPSKPAAAAAAPPAQSTPAQDADSDSDSDDYGPSLPQKCDGTSSTPNHSTARQIGPMLPPAEKPVQRDDWMIAPPPSSTSYSERDPTKIRARKFASNPTGRSSKGSDGGISAIWTETPEEKLQRLQNTVLGRDAPGSSSGQSHGGGQGSVSRKAQEEEAERNREIARKVEGQRGKSLYAEHQTTRRKLGQDKEEEDDPSKRGFDREKDMALGSKIGTAQRRDLMNNAKGFGGRFQQGSFL